MATSLHFSLAFCVILCLTYVQGIYVNPSTLVVGHRGDCAHYPENTMISFENGIAKGCNLFETDLRLSKDLEVVLIHDATVDRTTNGTGEVANMTLAQLESLDAGSWFNPKFAGQKIPTLRQALELIVNRHNLSVVLDLKVEGLGKYIAPIVKELNLQDRIVASCWTATQVEDIQRYLNVTVKQKLTSSLPANITNGYFAGLLASGVHGFSVRLDFITKAFISAAHQHVMPVNAWTVDDVENATKLITYGVDGIITDDVELIVNLIRSVPTDATSGDNRHPIVQEHGLRSGVVVAIALASCFIGTLVGTAFMMILAKRKRDHMYHPISDGKPYKEAH